MKQKCFGKKEIILGTITHYFSRTGSSTFNKKYVSSCEMGSYSTSFLIPPTLITDMTNIPTGQYFLYIKVAVIRLSVDSALGILFIHCERRY